MLAEQTIIAISKNNDLANCTLLSFLHSVKVAARLGLDPSGVMGEAYMVPFKDQCQLIPGYRGLVKLARNSGDVKSIWAEVVYSCDKFDYRLGLHPDIDHEPGDRANAKDSDITHVYAVAKMTDGDPQFVVLTRQEIEKIRASSRAGRFGPWVDWWAEMAKKSAVKRLIKMLPIETGSVFAKAVEIDNRIESGDRYDEVLGIEDDVIDVEALPSVPVESRGSQVAEHLAEQSHASAEMGWDEKVVIQTAEACGKPEADVRQKMEDYCLRIYQRQLGTLTAKQQQDLSAALAGGKVSFE